MKRRALSALCAFALVSGLFMAAGFAIEPSEMLQDPALEARARTIGQALRCVVCQNQSIDDSSAEVARDMRRAVRERLTAGDSDDQVFAYMVARYGDYVLLQPPFKTSTLVLWLGGPLVLLLAGGALLNAARRRTRRRSQRRNRSATRSGAASTRCRNPDAGVCARPSRHGDRRRPADPVVAHAASAGRPVRGRDRDLSRPARRDRARMRLRHARRVRRSGGPPGDRASHPLRRRSGPPAHPHPVRVGPAQGPVADARASSRTPSRQ